MQVFYVASLSGLGPDNTTTGGNISSSLQFVQSIACCVLFAGQTPHAEYQRKSIETLLHE